MSKKHLIKSKYIAIFDYFGKTLIVLSATSGGISITSFASIIRAPVGIASSSFTLIFSLTTGIIKKIIENNKKIKRRDIIKLLC